MRCRNIARTRVSEDSARSDRFSVILLHELSAFSELLLQDHDRDILDVINTYHSCLFYRNRKRLDDYRGLVMSLRISKLIYMFDLYLVNQ